MLKEIADSIKDAAREFRELERFFAPENRESRRIVFFGERGIHYRYFEDYIEQIFLLSDLDVSYITSDPEDPVLRTSNRRLRPFYFQHMLSAVFARLDSKVLAMTNPDLNRCGIKRAPAPVRHVYIYHGISSIHKGYRLGAFDFYDTIFCIAPYQLSELRRTEEIYSLPPKELIITGYPLVERIHDQHRLYRGSSPSAGQSGPVCLVAPTWGPSSIFETCIDEMIEALAGTKYRVWLRPHSEFVKRERGRMRALERAVQKTPNISFQLELSSMQCLHQADILVTEHSSISFEYALGTERQVLFIDTPMRVDNPEWEKVGMEPVENTYRTRIGLCLQPGAISGISGCLETLAASAPDFARDCPAIRNQLVSNWKQSARLGAEHILSICASA